MSATPIGLVGPAAPWAGGITRFTSDLATELERRGPLRWLSWRPSDTFTPPGTELDREACADPRADAMLGALDLRSWRRGGSDLRDCSSLVLTVTHPALLLAYAPLVAAFRRAGRHVVLICHNVLPHHRVPFGETLARRLLELADSAVVHAAAEARLARRLAPGVRLVEAFHPARTPEPWRRPPGGARLLAFGYVRPYKGLDDLLRALPALPEATLRVVGRFWDPVAPYRAHARRLGVADRVTFEDRYVPDTEIAELFASSDVVVCPYRQASQSGVVQLAFEHGRPVVATAVGGLAEAIVDGASGAIAAPGDPASLAAAIRRAFALPQASLERAIRAGLEQRTWPRYVDLVLEAAHA